MQMVNVTYRSESGIQFTDASESVETFKKFRPGCTVITVSEPFDWAPTPRRHPRAPWDGYARH